MVRKYLLILLPLIGFSSGFCQDKTLCIKGFDNTICSPYLDSADAKLQVAETISAARGNGYFGAEVDNWRTSGDSVIANINIGTQYRFIHITNHNFKHPEKQLDSNLTFSVEEFNTFQTSLLQYYENNGYPFANFQLYDFIIKNDSISSKALFNPYKKITYDSIQINGTSTLSKNYLARYLNVKQGDLYNEEDVKELNKKLRNLPLVKLLGTVGIVFYQDKARIILPINEVVTDRLDGIVGFAPNSSNSEQNSLLLTGEVNIELNNLFRSAKQLELHWRNYLQRSQQLDAYASWPYIASTKLGVAGGLTLNKFDTLFVNLKNKIAFQYQAEANNYIQAYYQKISSNLLSVDTAAIRVSKAIPDNNPFRVDNYGLAFYQRNYDYLPNPRKGFEFKIDGNIGTKTILRNSLVDKVLFYDSVSNQSRSIYDSLDKKSFRGSISLAIDYFIPIRKASTIYQKLDVSALFSEAVLFNELYSLGGFSTLRGFDENEIFASKALTYNVEYRYLLSSNSNVGVFFNTAVIENQLTSSKLIYEVPYGFGAAANIQVRGGILSLAYALGSRQNNPIQLSTAKFHFGFINYF